MANLCMEPFGPGHYSVHHLVNHSDNDAQHATPRVRGRFLHPLNEILVGLLALLANVRDLSAARVAVFPEAPPMSLFLMCRSKAGGKVERRRWIDARPR
jgi:hypothetical protein